MKIFSSIAKILMYLLNCAAVICVIYISISSQKCELYSSEKIELGYLWILVGLIIFKCIILLFTPESNKQIYRIVKSLVSTFTDIATTLLCVPLLNLSYGLLQLKGNYIDKIDLGAGFTLVRIWSKEELTEYLSNVLLKNPSMLAHIQNFKITPPKLEKLNENIINISKNIEDVETNLLYVIEELIRQKELLENQIADEKYLKLMNELKTENIDTFWVVVGKMIGGSFALAAATITFIFAIATVVTLVKEGRNIGANPTESDTVNTSINPQADPTYQTMVDYLLKGKTNSDITQVGDKLKMFKSFSKQINPAELTGLAEKIEKVEEESKKHNLIIRDLHSKVYKAGNSKDKLKPVYDSTYLNRNIEVAKARIQRLEKNLIPAKKLEEQVLVLNDNLDTVKANITTIEGTSKTVSKSINDIEIRLDMVADNSRWHTEALKRINPVIQKQQEIDRDLLRQRNELTMLKRVTVDTLDKQVDRMEHRVDSMEKGLEHLQRFIGDDMCVNIEKSTQDNTESITKLTSEVKELASRLEIQEIVREIVQEIISNNS